MSKLALLIVEDDEAVGLNLAAAAEDVGAAVIGPVGSVAAALERLDAGGIDGAVIDVRLQDRDVTPVALRLMEQSVPFLVHSGYALPTGLAALQPAPQVLAKPADPDEVMTRVVRLVTDARAAPGTTGAALAMMESALVILDSHDETFAALHLQSAIDSLTGPGRPDER